MKSFCIRKQLILISILLQYSITALCEGFYTIIAPGSLKSNRKYAVSITLHEASEAAAIKISLMGPDLADNQKLFLQPNETKFIDFQLPKLTGGSYKLVAEGLSGLVFKNERNLYANSDQGPHIFVQTDKKIYKPKDLVQFRVIIVDEHTRPLAVREPIRVEILDADSNRIKQFKNIKLQKGVFTADFQLCEHPVFGEWTVKTTISGRYSHTRSSTFFVRKYVLPKFKTYLECPKFIILEDNDKIAKVNLYAKYSYGKYVEGSARIDLRTDRYDTIVSASKEVDIPTIASIQFDLNNITLKDFNSLYINTTFTEKHTGNIATDSCNIAVQPYSYDINIDFQDIKFNGTKPYEIMAKVRYWNSSNVIDSETPVIMKHGSQNVEATLNEKGEATFAFEHEPNANHVFWFKNVTETFPNIYIPRKAIEVEQQSRCRLTLLNYKPKLGETIEVEISSWQNLPYFVYTLVGHGNILKTEWIKVQPNKKSHILKIEPSIEMVPQSFLYVHYIQNGSLLYEELKINLPRELENQVSISAPKLVKPGTEVTLEIHAESKSRVCLLAVDLNIHSHSSLYDILNEKIISDLEHDLSYVPIEPDTNYAGIESGLLTMTNAEYSFKLAFASDVEPVERTTPVSDTRGYSLIRTVFLETWLFKDLEITQDRTLLTLSIPDTITAWRITAFSINEQSGLGITKLPTDIITFQNFFISLNLPYSVKRGELITIPVVVFNYFDQSLDTEVTMINNELEYDFAGTTDSNLMSNKQNQTKQIRIPGNGAKTVPFLINPKKVGDIALIVIANNTIASDGVNLKLKVEPEGAIMHNNQVKFISLADKQSNISLDFITKIPDDAVPDSEYITIAVGGDILLPTLENLNNLVRLPTGSGEQNLLTFASNILVLDYLKASRQFDKQPQLIKQAKHFMEVGYQQQLSFRHQNGGFSVFGDKSTYIQRHDTAGDPSTWLTAYAIRFFIKASVYIPVEDRIIESGLDYLSKSQLENGEFQNTGYLIDTAHQNRYGLTAHILQAFLENSKYTAKYQTIIDKGIDFLMKNVENVEDLYSLAIIAATLQMAKNYETKELLQRIELQAKGDNSTRWWSQDNGNQNKDVEITAYCAQSLVQTKANTKAILKWLIEQRNNLGGFKSTHDTVVGLEAIVKLAKKYNNINSNLKILFKAKDNAGTEVEKGKFLVNQQNALRLQKRELPNFTRHINYEANGAGIVLLQLSYQYHIKHNDKLQDFRIQTKIESINASLKEIEICFEYLPAAVAAAASSTNMVIMEVNLPSGYRSEAASNSDLLENDLIQKIESKNDDTTIIFYLDNLAANVEHCLSIEAEFTHKIENLKPAAILMYDYYNTSCHDTAFYEI